MKKMKKQKKKKKTKTKKKEVFDMSFTDIVFL